jgi:hypothetical protein
VFAALSPAALGLSAGSRSSAMGTTLADSRAGA